MIKAQLVFCRLETVLDSPAAALHADQFLDGGPNWSPGGEESQILIRDGAADQKTARPKPRAAFLIFTGIDIGQFHISPVIEARPLGAFARRQALPVTGPQALRNAFHRPCDGLGLAPGVDAVIGGDAKNIALAGPAQRPFNPGNAVDAIGGNKGKRHSRGDGPLDHGNCQGRLGCEGRFLRDMRRLHAGRIVRPSLRQIKRPVDEGMAVPRDITGKHADLAVRDLYIAALRRWLHLGL